MFERKAQHPGALIRRLLVSKGARSMVTRPRVASAAGQPVFSHDQTRYIAMGLAREAATLFALYKVWRPGPGAS